MNYEQCPKCGGSGKIPSGSSLKAFREQHGLTAKEVAAAMKRSRSYICDVENDRRQPGVEFFEAYAKAVRTHTKLKA